MDLGTHSGPPTLSPERCDWGTGTIIGLRAVRGENRKRWVSVRPVRPSPRFRCTVVVPTARDMCLQFANVEESCVVGTVRSRRRRGGALSCPPRAAFGTSETSRRDPARSAYEGQCGHAADIVRGPTRLDDDVSAAHESFARRPCRRHCSIRRPAVSSIVLCSTHESRGRRLRSRFCSKRRRGGSRGNHVHLALDQIGDK
jgi:hypothetical protein